MDRVVIMTMSVSVWTKYILTIVHALLRLTASLAGEISSESRFKRVFLSFSGLGHLFSGVNSEGIPFRQKKIIGSGLLW